MNKTIIIIGLVLLAGVGYLTFKGDSNPPLSGYLVPTVTITSSSLPFNATTSVNSTAGLQRLDIYNLGVGQIHCGFNVTGTLAAATLLTEGFVINAAGSSTNTFVSITDPNLLAKTIVCTPSATTTINIVKY